MVAVMDKQTTRVAPVTVFDHRGQPYSGSVAVKGPGALEGLSTIATAGKVDNEVGPRPIRQYRGG